MAKKLWGYTSTSIEIVKIYIDPDLGSSQEYGHFERTDTDSEIRLHPDVFLDPLILDETLAHEFVHVLEHHFADELKRFNPRGCTRLALVFGREMPRMQRQLKQVSPSEAVAGGPAGMPPREA